MYMANTAACWRLLLDILTEHIDIWVSIIIIDPMLIRILH